MFHLVAKNSRFSGAFISFICPIVIVACKTRLCLKAVGGMRMAS